MIETAVHVGARGHRKTEVVKRVLQLLPASTLFRADLSLFLLSIQVE